MEFPNWFTKTFADIYFSRNLTPYANQPLRCLQLGAFTGDATEWMFENILTHPDSVLYDVDTWEGSKEPTHGELDWAAVEKFYLNRHKEKIDSGRLIVYKGTTDSFFSSEMGRQQFNFIYVDADHKASSVLKDGMNSIYRLPSGGVVAFDDYRWTKGEGQHLDPKPAIDAIAACYYDELVVLDSGFQVWFRKR